MMEVKSFFYELLDGKQYEFCERAKEDLSLYHIQTLIRKERTEEAYRYIKDEDFRQVLILSLFKGTFSATEVWEYIMGHVEEQYKLIYHSFKIKHPNITFEQFQTLINRKLANNISELLVSIEKDDNGMPDEDVCKSLGINKTQLVKINKTQPHVYQWLKTNVKKKMEKE